VFGAPLPRPVSELSTAAYNPESVPRYGRENNNERRRPARRSLAVDIVTRWYGDAAVMKASGILDHDSAAAFSDELMYLFQKIETGGLVIDVSGLEYMSTAGLKSLLMICRASADAKRRTFIAAPSAIVRGLLEMSDARLVLQVVPTLSEAVRMVSPAAAHAYREAAERAQE
jgi:anti-anti-sigma factor